VLVAVGTARADAAREDAGASTEAVAAALGSDCTVAGEITVPGTVCPTPENEPVITPGMSLEQMHAAVRSRSTSDLSSLAGKPRSS
jgi:hypothetical protein